MKFVLLFTGTMADQEAWDNQTDAERTAAYGRVNEWFEEHTKAGRIIGGEELQGPMTATTVRSVNGKQMITDGPFMDTKEVIGGLVVVEVKDKEEAVSMAKGWPGGPVVVRPVVDHSSH
jgi:hypothetical protein